jgi:hypothetical protein
VQPIDENRAVAVAPLEGEDVDRIWSGGHGRKWFRTRRLPLRRRGAWGASCRRGVGG